MHIWRSSWGSREGRVSEVVNGHATGALAVIVNIFKRVIDKSFLTKVLTSKYWQHFWQFINQLTSRHLSALKYRNCIQYVSMPQICSIFHRYSTFRYNENMWHRKPIPITFLRNNQYETHESNPTTIKIILSQRNSPMQVDQTLLLSTLYERKKRGKQLPMTQMSQMTSKGMKFQPPPAEK